MFSTDFVDELDLKGSAALRGDQEELLRRLAINDEQAVASVLGARGRLAGWSELDVKSQALSQLAALVSLGADAASYQWSVEAALGSGATEEQIIGVLLAVAPVVGMVRLNSAAVALAGALGRDINPPDGP